MAGVRRDGLGPEIAFVFVRYGDPPPTEWLARHPGWVKFPATLVTQPAEREGSRRTQWSASGTELGSSGGGAARRASTGGLVGQRPELRNRTGSPRPGRFGAGDGQGASEDPIAAYLRVTGSLAGMGLGEPIAAWHGGPPHGAENAATSAIASVPTMPLDAKADLRASAEGLAHDPVPVGSDQVAQLEGPPEEETERLGPTGQPLSLQEEANTNMYYNAFRSLRDIDPTNPAVTREVVRPTNWVPSDADVQDIQRALDAARQPTVKPESPSQDQLGSRSREAYDALAADPSHGNEIEPKGRQERQVGLNAERQGLLPGPITRDPTGAAEFIDGTGQAWDVKAFNSKYPSYKGGFNVYRDAGVVDDSLTINENVIIDTTNMTQQDIDSLRSEGIVRGWGRRVIWP